MRKTIDAILQFEVIIKGKWQLSRLLLLVGIIPAILWAIYFAADILVLPHQISYLEGAAPVQTWFFLRGDNPYTLENQPLGFNNYGVLYSLTVLPFACVFGNTLLVHRAVTLLFVILSSLIMFIVVKKTKGDILIAATSAVFIAITAMSRVGFGQVGAFPSATGMFFFLAAILLPFIRSFDRFGLFLSAVATMAAFYTKPYFLLAFGVVSSFIFLFDSKKKGLLYSLLFASGFVISILVVRRVFPMYFIGTIWGNVSNSMSSFTHMLNQLQAMANILFPVIVTILLILATGNSGKHGAPPSSAFFRINILNWKEPLLVHPINYFFYALFFTLLIFASFLGWQASNWLGYASQVILPLFFVWYFGKMLPMDKAKLVVVLLVLANMFAWERSSLASDVLRPQDQAEWTRLSDYMENSKSILHPPLVATDIISLGLDPIDSGHTILFYNIKQYPDSILTTIPFEKIKRDGFIFENMINRRIEKRKYDLVITAKNKAAFFDYWLLEQNYTLVDEMDLYMNLNGASTIQIWRPKQ